MHGGCFPIVLSSMVEQILATNTLSGSFGDGNHACLKPVVGRPRAGEWLATNSAM